MAYSQYFYFYSVGMDNLQVIFSIIQNFAAVNLKTEKGREIGRLVYDKHKTIKEFLIKIGVSEKNAEIDCCKRSTRVQTIMYGAFRR